MLAFMVLHVWNAALRYRATNAAATRVLNTILLLV